MCEICGHNSELSVCKDCEDVYPDLKDGAFTETLKHMENWILDPEWEVM